MKLLSRLGKVNLLKVLGNPLTESQLLRGIRKYITLGVLIREIKMMPLSRLGIVNLHTELENLFTKSQLLRGFRKYITLGFLRETRMKLLSRLGKASLLERL